jgi:hypothetical protein
MRIQTFTTLTGARLSTRIAAAVLAHAFVAGAADVAAQVDGASADCTDFRLVVLPAFIDVDITDEGWVWVQRANPALRFQSVSGVAVASDVAYNDTPSNHNSHDVDFSILVDAAYDHLLSNVNRPNTGNRDNLAANDGADDLTTPTRIGVEWELGTFPRERGQVVPQRYFPRWAWPSVGDRVWANGHWVFDCGHGKELGLFVPNPSQTGPSFLFVGQEYFRSEIHPARAIASMRQQADTLPGTGTTRVPVTATDLYIHGEAGFVTDILNCGMSIIVDGVNGTGNPDTCPTRTSPIAVNFDFHICLPPRQSGGAELVWRIENGPGNTVATPQPKITPVPAPAGCTNDDVADARNPNDSSESYDLNTALHVEIALAGSGVGDVETYARRIVAGWIEPPATPLQHLRLTLDRLNVHSSGDGGTIASDDGELTFSFVNVDRAPDEWIRIADYAPVATNGNSVLNDYDPSLFGDSFTILTGAVFDFYVRNGQDVGVSANMYDQDCYDGDFGIHFLSLGTYVGCALDIDETGNNDRLEPIAVRLVPGGYGNPAPALGNCPGLTVAVGSAPCNVTTIHKPRIKDIGPPIVIEFRPDYELDFTLERLAPGDEDTTDLKVEKTCTHDGEVLLVGKPLTCTITVSNLGPGLPRGVSIVDTITGLGSSQYTMGTPTGAPCTLSPAGFSCSLDTLKVGGTVTITATIVPSTPGTIVNQATASTNSTEADTTNDGSSNTTTVFLPVEVDIQPGMTPSAINVRQSGLIPVAILTTSSFDAATIDPSTVCFGDAGSAAERSCTEAHGTGHLLDVTKDKIADLLLHFQASLTGIDPKDVSACLTAVTTTGVHVYGCDTIIAK